MSDEKPKPSWRSAAKAAPPNAAQNSLLKKALEVNPSLKGDKKTEEFLKDVQSAKKAGKEQAAEPDAPATTPLIAPDGKGKSVVLVTQEIKKWLAAERTRIATERKNAQAKQAQLEKDAQTHLDRMRMRVLEVLRATDPSLASPMTSTVLGSHKKLLADVQLDDAKMRKALGL